ncbi:MAG: methylmalonyl-CoA mutase, partial [Holophagales bacterium]|nr:methylmalonyl-CoA mutase [Holophagales bacterium]
EPKAAVLIPDNRNRYLAEIAEAGRAAEADAGRRAAAASKAHGCYRALAELDDPDLPKPLAGYAPEALDTAPDQTLARLRRRYQEALAEVGADAAELLKDWPGRVDAARADEYSYPVRGREVTGENYVTTLSHLRMPKLALPEYSDWGDLLRFLLKHNLPGAYPYTAGVYPYRRRGEEPTRMFAGEGIAERTNRRFHFVSRGQPANRLSTAFDSVTLYGSDPGLRPDIWGKVGNSGVSIATVDDMKRLYSGFDLCDPATSVSMTINGPAPTILAFFMNAAVDQQVERHLRESGGLERARAEIDRRSGGDVPVYRGELPEENDGLGLALLGISGDQVVERDVYERIRADALSRVRGTVQADILKEDQAQNTCIFSTEFSLRMMGDVQQFFIDHNVRNYYSASVSGYHIAEAGANPITQLAFTLANGFTIVEYYLARGMAIDDFAPNLSFFFSNGMDPEYAVIGRVARRIWARAMRERYGASARSQMLKYHIQTSGRSLHAQEIQFNDIRTTLQALYGILDRCNSLHTNAFDEAITTPTEQSVRRALAIQLIINREFGLNRSENPWQGSFALDQLTDAVEEAVYLEFERLAERGGVLAAMDTMYQRSKIQDESMEYEAKKHDGSLPVVGVNTFLAEGQDFAETVEAELIRSTDDEKRQQIESLAAFHRRHGDHSTACLDRLQDVARRRGNVFEELMETVKHCSLGQISDALYRVGGEYRRSM